MEVRAQLNNYRRSPRKVRLLAKLLKGLGAEEAENQLRYTIKGSSPDFDKLLKSALANAENNFGLEKGNLYVKDIIVNEGAKLKRWLPRAYGRASLILKRTSHIELVIAERVEGKGRKKVKKQEIKEVKEIKEADVKEKIGEEELKSTSAKASADKEEKEFLDEKKKSESSKGILKRVFRRKSM